jgi:hypothetical protein
MKKALILAVALLFGSVAAAQAGQQDFTLVNDTGHPICDVYISPSDVADWQEDLLENDKYCLSQGEKYHITFGRDLKGIKMWDLRVVDDKGKDKVYEDINLMETSTITLRRSGVAELD